MIALGRLAGCLVFILSLSLTAGSTRSEALDRFAGRLEQVREGERSPMNTFDLLRIDLDSLGVTAERRIFGQADGELADEEMELLERFRKVLLERPEFIDELVKEAHEQHLTFFKEFREREELSDRRWGDFRKSRKALIRTQQRLRSLRHLADPRVLDALAPLFELPRLTSEEEMYLRGAEFAHEVPDAHGLSDFMFERMVEEDDFYRELMEERKRKGTHGEGVWKEWYRIVKAENRQFQLRGQLNQPVRFGPAPPRSLNPVRRGEVGSATLGSSNSQGKAPSDTELGKSSSLPLLIAGGLFLFSLGVFFLRRYRAKQSS